VSRFKRSLFSSSNVVDVWKNYLVVLSGGVVNVYKYINSSLVPNAVEASMSESGIA